MNDEFYLMGTGSRSMVIAPDAKDIYANLEAYILMLWEKYPNLILISGMAEGWDEAIAKVGYRNNIPYDVYIPNPNYGKFYWTAPNGTHPKQGSLTGNNRLPVFNMLVKGARKRWLSARTLYVGGLHCNMLRNQHMVDACNAAVVYNAQSSGTRDAISRLKQANKPYEVYPFDLQGTLF